VLERSIALAALVALGATASDAAPSAGPASAPAAVHTVVIENMQFAPAELHVRRGERITWVNKDLVPHSATAKDKSFDSRSIAAGASWSTVVTHTGHIPYACTFHPTMVATLVVE
jgi:plastocyanin